MKIIVGVYTYGPAENLKEFIQSIMTNTEDVGANNQLLFVCYDDHTEDPVVAQDKAAFCQKYGFKFVYNMQHRGMYDTWNSIINYEEADIAIVFSDDITFFSPGWLIRLLFFMENNPSIGTVHLNPTLESGLYPGDEKWNGAPMRNWGDVGCAFAIRQEYLAHDKYEYVLDGCGNSDMINRLADQHGLYSYVLPWPPVHKEKDVLMEGFVAWKLPPREIKWMDRNGQVQSFQESDNISGESSDNA